MARNPSRGNWYGGGLKKIDITTAGIPQNWAGYDASDEAFVWLGPVFVAAKQTGSNSRVSDQRAASGSLTFGRRSGERCR